jgi:hypothetical protein
MSAREAATPSTPCGCINSFSQTLETEKRQNRSAKIIEGTPSKTMGDGSKPASEIKGNHSPRMLPPQTKLINAIRMPSQFPSIIQKAKAHRSSFDSGTESFEYPAPPNTPPTARPCRRTGQIRRPDNPSAPPSPAPNPNSAPPDDANHGRHHTPYVVCRSPIVEAAKTRHTTNNAPSRPSSMLQINLGQNLREWKCGSRSCPSEKTRRS